MSIGEGSYWPDTDHICVNQTRFILLDVTERGPSNII